MLMYEILLGASVEPGRRVVLHLLSRGRAPSPSGWGSLDGSPVDDVF